MLIRHTFRLLFVAAITSIFLFTAPTFAATPGTWVGIAEFGTFEIVVNGAGTGIEQIKYKFSNYSCGIVTYGDFTVTVSRASTWPISNNEFSITVQIGSDETMTTAGRFESSSQASGTFRAEVYDTVCTGTWSTSGGSVTVYTLSVSRSGSGSGTVTSNPSGINCGSTCSKSFSSGTNVTLMANPSSGSTFGGWSGACSGSGSCNVSMSQSRNVTANFLVSVMVEVTSAFSGLWYNPDQDGHGFSIMVHSATNATVFWYTFSPMGTPIWILGDGDIIVDRIEALAYYFEGMEFGTWDPSDKRRLTWGNFTIEFHSCNSATLTYNSTLAYESGEEFGSGTISLVKLASIDGLVCQ
jgi:hypothetical protein